VGLFSTDYFNEAAKAAIEWTEKLLSPEEKDFLKSIRLVIGEEDFSVVHGSLDGPELFDYILDIESAYRCFLKMEKDICFVAHTHIPSVFFMKGDEIGYTFEDSIEIKKGIRYIINVGSIGQPRDGNPLATYCIFDADRMRVDIKRVDYDIEIAKNKILSSGLPQILGYRLLEGR
jgi:diadenosine tetraphosphatase ApaH/serine/threonine PP2A family protein phosphatase